MIIKQFYESLEKHDWYYPWSDDHKVYRRGEESYRNLESIARHAGPAHAWLFQQYKAHMCSGQPWGTERQPKPAMPETMSLNTMIDVRAGYERLAFLPETEQEQAHAALMAKVSMYGATSDDAEPFMLKEIPVLMDAWRQGQQMAIEAHHQLTKHRKIS